MRWLLCMVSNWCCRVFPRTLKQRHQFQWSIHRKLLLCPTANFMLISVRKQWLRWWMVLLGLGLHANQPSRSSCFLSFHVWKRCYWYLLSAYKRNCAIRSDYHNWNPIRSSWTDKRCHLKRDHGQASFSRRRSQSSCFPTLHKWSHHKELRNISRSRYPRCWLGIWSNLRTILDCWKFMGIIMGQQRICPHRYELN